MDAKTFDNMIDAFLDGKLADEYKEQFESVLQKDENARQQFWRRVHFHAAIRRAYESREGSSACVDSAMLLDLAQMLESSESNAQLVEMSREELESRSKSKHEQRKKSHISTSTGFGQTQSQPSQSTRHYVIPKPLFYGSIAAIVAVIAALAWPLLPDGSDKIEPQLKQAQVDPPVVVKKVAKLRGIVEVVWEGENAPSTGERLMPGEFAMSYGLVEIVFNNEAQVIIEGPARFTIDSDSAMTLHEGRLVGLCETDNSHGFVVATPGARVEDLGTEFGVQVDSSMDSEVHVFDGEIILSVETNDGVLHNQNLWRNNAARVDVRSREIKKVAVTESRFFRNMVSSYELAVRKSDPLMYFRFDEKADMKYVRDSSVNRLHGRVRSNVTLGAVGVLKDDPSRSMHIDGQQGRIVIDRVDYKDIPEADFTKHFSVESWVYLPSDGPKGIRRIVSNRGLDVNRPENAGPREMDAGFGFGFGNSTSLGTPDDAVWLTLFGVVDVRTTRPAPHDEWFHLAATVDEHGAVDIYVNGELWETINTLEGRPIDENHTKIGRESDNSLFLGQNPFAIALPWQKEAFVGHLDEFAIYSRPLTEDEIAERVRLGRGEEKVSN